MNHESSPALRRMTELAGRWEEEDDQRAVFLRCYSMMTGNMLQALAEGRFQDRDWVSRLLGHFAGFYFEALERYEDPDRETPAVWQIAHSVAQGGEALAVQNLILGVNAHINYDLVLATADMLGPEWSLLDRAGQDDRYEDYRLVNEIIGETIDSVQDLVLERIDPELDILDKLFGPFDELLTSQLIRHWRGDVWKHAKELVGLTTEEEREALRRQVETAAIQRAEFIMHGPKSALKGSLFDL